MGGKTLILAVKGKYFQQIKSGEKKFEYRARSKHWVKRIRDRHYDTLVICWGYPSSDNAERRIEMPYRGYVEETITHEFFDNVPTDVFSIKLTGDE